MITTASKFLYGLAFAAFLAAYGYGVATGSGDVSGETDFGLPTLNMNRFLGPLVLGYKGGVGDHLGYTGLMSIAGIALVLAVATSFLRDADPTAQAKALGVDRVSLPVRTSPTIWPVIGAFSAALLVVGLALSPALFIAGIVGLAITAFEWMITAWADRATGDAEVNDTVRQRFMLPLEVPMLGALSIGAFVLLLSRVLLAVSKTNSALVAIVVGSVIFFLACAIAWGPLDLRTVGVSALAVGAVILLVTGVWAGVAGERDFEHHHEDEAHEEAMAGAES